MEYIYVAINPLIRGMVKIGRTSNLDKRLKELSQILTEPFSYIKTYEVEKGSYVESFIHESLKNIRVRKDREFFYCDEGYDITKAVDLIIQDAHYFYAKKRYSHLKPVVSIEALVKDIRGMRVTKNLTQEDLAHKAQVSAATISRMERGEASEVSAHNLIKILSSIGCQLYVGMDCPPDKERRRVRSIYRITKP